MLVRSLCFLQRCSNTKDDCRRLWSGVEFFMRARPMSDASVCALSIQVVRPLVIKHANYGMSLKLACRQTSDENITMNCEAAWRAKDFDAYIAEHRFFCLHSTSEISCPRHYCWDFKWCALKSWAILCGDISPDREKATRLLNLTDVGQVETQVDISSVENGLFINEKKTSFYPQEHSRCLAERGGERNPAIFTTIPWISSTLN